MPGSPARPASGSRSTPTRTRRAHSRYAELGIGQARRAWLTKEQVLNTRPWAEIAKGALSTFREDGAAALEWVAPLPRAHPGAARARAGRAGRDQGGPARGAARGGGAVRSRAARPGRDPHARNHPLAEPALLRVLRVDGRRARDPGRAADRRPQPGRHPLARLTGAAGARGGDARLAAAAARAARAVARAHRGRGLGGRRHRARGRAGGGAREACRRLLRAHALVDAEGRAAARARGAADARGRRLRAAARRTRPLGACAVVATVGTTSSTAVDPSPRSPTAPPRRTSGSTSTPPTRAPRRCAPSSAVTSPAGSGRTRSA